MFLAPMPKVCLPNQKCWAQIRQINFWFYFGFPFSLYCVDMLAVIQNINSDFY